MRGNQPPFTQPQQPPVAAARRAVYPNPNRSDRPGRESMIVDEPTFADSR